MPRAGASGRASDVRPRLVFLALGGGIGVVFAMLNARLGPGRRPRPTHTDPYECGLPSEFRRCMRFSISFYLVAMLFLIFDLEVLLLFPTAVVLRDFGMHGLLSVGLFIGLLVVAFVYEWRRGALWSGRPRSPAGRAVASGAPVELLERDAELAALRGALDDARHTGRVVLVAGEAGIGKTRLLEAAMDGAPGLRTLWGACDPLVTPRPLGPLQDVARQVGGALADAMADGASRERLLVATLDELASPPSVLVVEDIHWIDAASLDVLALLARRLRRSCGCIALTCRQEELGRRPDVRRALAAIPHDLLRVVEPAPLSPAAVRTLVGGDGEDAAELHRVTGGNPFFVTEVLASAAGGGVPSSVREAVALQVDALAPEARAVASVAAVVPRPAELWLLEATGHAGPAAVDACLEAGILRLDGEAVTFRHDLSRRAVLEGLGALERRRLERAVGAALEARGDADPGRLVHHALAAGDRVAVARLAPAAARAASVVGAHREALEHWEAALAARDDDEALEGVSIEAYLCGKPERALEARRTLLARQEAAGDPLAVGGSERWLSRVLWWSGRGAEAVAHGDRAIAVLDALPPGPELAMALSGRSQLAMLADEADLARSLGTRAAKLARTFDDGPTLAHALTNVGTTLLGGPEHERGRALLEEAFALAVTCDEHDHAARALVNLVTGIQVRWDDPPIPADLERALAFTRGRDLDGYVQYLLGVRGNLLVLRGEWDAAEADARASLELGEHFGVSACPALIVLGRLQSRRGDPEAADTLEAARRHAEATGEVQCIGPVAAALAEHAWREGDPAAAAAAVRDAYALALDRRDPRTGERLAYWLWRAGALDDPPPDATGPYALSLRGDWAGAAAAWDALGFPYEAAEARCDGEDEAALLEALETFDALGATRSALGLRRRLRARGMLRVPRGPRAGAQTDPAGLTPRQAEVLAQLRRGGTNAEIAERLVISPKTVDHHVSAVLAKLGVRTRREAVAAEHRTPA